MLYNSKTTTKELLIKMIKAQQHEIEMDANEIKELTHSIVEQVKELEYNIRNSHVEVISYPPCNAIKSKLDELAAIYQNMNFRKNLIRDYIQQLYLLNGFYTSEWLK